MKNKHLRMEFFDLEKWDHRRYIPSNITYSDPLLITNTNDMPIPRVGDVLVFDKLKFDEDTPEWVVRKVVYILGEELDIHNLILILVE